LVMFLLASCSGTRFIPEGEKLYTGADIELQPTEKLKHKKFIKNTAEQALQPKPNKGFLGMRPKLWIYFVSGDTSAKGIGKWFRDKLGEPPVYISTIKPDVTAKFIDAKLYNIGIFNSRTSYEIKQKKKTAEVEYLSFVHKQYEISKIIFPVEDDILNEFIKSSEKKSLLKSGDPYNLDVLKGERERIDLYLKDQGYFYFNPDYLLFKADTNETDKTINLALSVKPETPYQAMLIFRINNVYVDPFYTLENEEKTITRDTMIIDDVIFLEKPGIRPKVILRSLFLRKDDTYSRKRHSMTLNRIMTMGNFRYANIKFEESDTLNPGFLDQYLLLTPMPKRTFRSELMMVSKSNDFVGPKVNINYRNRNALRGAELLNFIIGGSVETQFSGKYKNLYSYEINPKVEFFIPRFVVPFRIKNPGSFYIPKTKISFSYNYLKRIDYFNLTSFQFTYGYMWKENIKKEHELNPISINFTSLSNISPQFNDVLSSNPYLKKSYEEQFIAGLFYSFTFNEQLVPTQKNQFYFNGTAELSGNTLSLINKIFNNEKASPENPQKFAGAVYSQFARFTIDLRNYFNFPRTNKFAVRFYTGLGKPYGNSSTLPYIKQFFSGGPSSIRAFQVNSVGPGTFSQEDVDAFLETGGDIKLEGNAEYRFNIYNIFKGALFIDGGNTWLLKSIPDVASDPFSFKDFHKELAVGTGFGIRLDATFFVLRFDLAIPLRKPWLPEQKRWVIDQIKPGSPDWRRDNLVLNIAIGYPF
jgi:outer membrane protein insertion porin family